MKRFRRKWREQCRTLSASPRRRTGILAQEKDKNAVAQTISISEGALIDEPTRAVAILSTVLDQGDRGLLNRGGRRGPEDQR
jgi:hypothetical protein